MEKMLKNVFDYQRFSPNSKLAALIEATERRYSAALDDDDMGLVSAAGVPELPKDEEGDKHDGN